MKDKELALRVIKLLSALESLMLYVDKRMPDYLLDDLVGIVKELRDIVLDDDGIQPAGNEI